MPKGLSLHVGLNGIDPDHYRGWDGELYGAEPDADAMEQLAQSRGFDATKLLTRDATAEAVISAIQDAAQQLQRGDLFFLSFAGHGGQVPDLNDEELDRADETWLTYDRQLVDDELHFVWARFRPGVRMIVVSDTCHGGAVTNARIVDEELSPPVSTPSTTDTSSLGYRAMPMDVMKETYRSNQSLYDGIQKALPSASSIEVDASLIAFLGCKDWQLAKDGWDNGLFTEKLLNVWGSGTWNGGHADFLEAISSLMPDDQSPNYKPVGAANPTFERQQPFTI